MNGRTANGGGHGVFATLVLYGIRHIGAFTHEGTFLAAIEKLPFLRGLGVNAIEIMPVADFPGDRNWGYDGVSLFAPARCYGHPDDLRALVDAAHAHGIAVVLDVVYNHLGPDGNYLGAFSPFYFTKKHKTPWGDALNFDDEQSGPVRAFFITNAIYWLEEFHIDGLRLDATHAMQDDSPRHILEEIADAVHERGCYVFAEVLNAILPRSSSTSRRGFGLNAVYADDFCHTVQVAPSAMRASARISPARPTSWPANCHGHGWLYRVAGRASAPANRAARIASIFPRNGFFSASRTMTSRVTTLSANGSTISRRPRRTGPRARCCCSRPTRRSFSWGRNGRHQRRFFISPTTRMNSGGRCARDGKRNLRGSGTLATPQKAKKIPDPQDASTFEKSKLPWEETGQEPHAGMLALYRECLRLRMTSDAFRPDGRESWKVGNKGMIALHFRDDSDWLVLVDFSGSHHCSLPEEEFCRLRTGKKMEPCPFEQ